MQRPRLSGSGPVALVAWALLMAPWGAPPRAETAAEVASLAGLPGLQVLVEELFEAAAADGLERAGMETTVEQELRRLRVPVVEDASGLAAGPELRVRVRMVRAGDVLAYSISMMLSRDASLARAPEGGGRAITWESLAVGFAAEPQQDVSRALRMLAESFARDFTAANAQGALPGRRRPGS